MKPYAACTTAVLALLLAGISTVHGQRDYRGHSLDLLRLLADKPWIGLGPHNRWDRAPRIDLELSNIGYEPHIPRMQDTEDKSYGDDDYDMRGGSQKRSAVATALNSSRRRRQPTPTLGMLNDMDSFFDHLRDNLETLVSLSPQERSSLFHETPSVVSAPPSNNIGGGSGGGARKLYALRPLRPTGNIRSYNRRSLVEADGAYPGANHHDPALLWAGLGR